ncbi:MAG: VanZ family protein [Firmicutes bacterium]|nr:VanZ family protein [Bacillota bacterium]
MTAADRPGLRRFLLWSPVVIQMALIFYFSHQPSRSPVLDWFPLPFSLGHFLGYALLGALLYRAFAGGLSFSWNAAAAGRSLLISLLYAFSDEFHQLFVPGRDASFLDILLDGAGAAAFLLFYWLVLSLRSRRRSRREGPPEPDAADLG